MPDRIVSPDQHSPNGHADPTAWRRTKLQPAPPAPTPPASPQPEERSLVRRLGPKMALLLVVTFWTSAVFVTKALFTQVQPLVLIFVRFAIMMALAGAVMVIRQRGVWWRIDRADLARFAAAGLIGHTLFQLAFILGLNRTSAFSASLLVAMVPLFTLILLALLGEPTPRQAWFGVGISLVGLIVFLFDKRGGSSGTLAGDLLSLAAALTFAIFGIISRPLYRKYPFETCTAWTALLGGVPLLLITLPATLRQDWSTVTPGGWLGMIYLAVFSIYVAYVLWNWGIAQRGAAAASAFGLLTPVATGIVAALFFGEQFHVAKVLGAALVLAGLVIVRLPQQRSRPTAAA